jgi:hypothetical protein
VTGNAIPDIKTKMKEEVGFVTKYHMSALDFKRMDDALIASHHALLQLNQKYTSVYEVNNILRQTATILWHSFRKEDHERLRTKIERIDLDIAPILCGDDPNQIMEFKTFYDFKKRLLEIYDDIYAGKQRCGLGIPKERHFSPVQKTRSSF